jgi:hypothetical protein
MATATKKKVSKKKAATKKRPRVLKRPAKKKAVSKTAAKKTAKHGQGMSLVMAAATVLRGSKGMTAREIFEKIDEKGLWWPARGGKTPVATLSTCLIRDIASEEPQFERVSRGVFRLLKKAA